jgi:hypothetical protein
VGRKKTSLWMRKKKKRRRVAEVVGSSDS